MNDNDGRPNINTIRVGPNMGSPGRASSRLASVRYISCEGGALPVIMSIPGLRETHDYLRNL